MVCSWSSREGVAAAELLAAGRRRPVVRSAALGAGSVTRDDRLEEVPTTPAGAADLAVTKGRWIGCSRSSLRI